MDTYVVGHLAHQLSGNLMENMLQVDNSSGSFEPINTLSKILRESNFGENSKVSSVEEAQPSLSLDFPELPVRVDDAIACVVSPEPKGRNSATYQKDPKTAP